MPDIMKTFELLDSFTALPIGWNFGQGVPASNIALKYSKDLTRYAYDIGVQEVEAFPGPSGEIQVCFYEGENTLEMTCEVDGSITVSFEQGDENLLYMRGVSFITALSILREFLF